MRAFVLDGDKFYCNLIKGILKDDYSLNVEIFYNGKDFLKKIFEQPDIITLDLELPDYKGMDIFQIIKNKCPDSEIVVISEQDDIPTVVQLLKQGAYDYISKSENVKDRLSICLANIINQRKIKNELSLLKTEIDQKYDLQRVVIGGSNVVRELSSLINKALNIPNIHVFIFGENGTGKELMAKIIHFNSARRNSPFVTVRLSALPPDEVETELFGYESGVFEHSNLSRIGRLEEANGGTLYIEDLHEMRMDMQLKLLRVLQEGEITRTGSSGINPINVRIISATNKDLHGFVKEKRFREDLYFKLKGLPINLPLLKDRRKDIILLADYFLKQFCKNNEIDKIVLTKGAKRKLLNYSYPGNVRELKVVVELAAVLTNNGKIEEDDIVFNSSYEAPDLLSEELTLKEYNQIIIRYYLDKYNNVMKVAEKLAIGKSTIYNFLKQEKK